MSYTYGGLTLANVGDIITQSSVSDNFQKVVENSAGATSPIAGAGGPRTGQLWYDTTDLTLKVNAGDPVTPQWELIEGDATVAATQPLNPTLGQLWFNTVANQLKTYNGIDWVNSSSATAFGTVQPVQPSIGDLWYDTTNGVNSGILKVYDGSTFIPASTTTLETLLDVNVTAKVSLQSSIMWDATATNAGVTGLWVPNQIYDASPTGGATNDF
jgi:hypothetical protein